MFLSKKLVTYTPVVVYEKTSGASGITDNIVIAPGLYDIVCIGGGGGAAAAVGGSNTNRTRYWANGGAGGTVRVQVFVHRQTEVLVVVGHGKMSSTGYFSASGASFVGKAGAASGVSGIDDLVLLCNGGSGGSITSVDQSNANAVGGAVGKTSVSGSAIKRILINNTKDIVGPSGSVPSNVTSKPLTWTDNINWEKDPSKGSGAGVQYNSTQYIAQIGRGGYVRITKL